MNFEKKKTLTKKIKESCKNSFRKNTFSKTKKRV